VSVPEKLLGAGTLVMALCCALLPPAGAALGGGLTAGAGAIGLVWPGRRGAGSSPSERRSRTSAWRSSSWSPRAQPSSAASARVALNSGL
jgi:hypothetical protein